MSGVLWRRHVAARDNDLQPGAASFDCRCRGPYRSSSPPLFILSVFLFLLFFFSFFAPFVILLYMCCLSNSFVFFILSLSSHLQNAFTCIAAPNCFHNAYVTAISKQCSGKYGLKLNHLDKFKYRFYSFLTWIYLKIRFKVAVCSCTEHF